MLDIVFSGKFYYNGEFQDLDIGVSDGIITDIKKHINFKRKRLKNAVIPAGTDTHVHFRDPGETYKEDFRTGTVSAIFGGTTTVFDMPNNKIKIDNYTAYSDKLEIVRRKAYCDFGLYSMFNGNNSSIISKDSSGIKIYLGDTTNVDNINSFNINEIENVNNMNIPVFFHAEDKNCLDKNYKKAHNLREYNQSRPMACEDIAVNTASSMKFKKGVITHMTHYMNTDYIKEVAPHHLLLNDEMPLKSYGKVNPPLRDSETQKNLLGDYINNRFNIVSSDHATHSQNEREEFEYSKSGIIGVETRIPLLLALVQKKIISFETFYNTCIYNPDKLFNLKKGEIKIGNYADFMTVDFSKMERLNDYTLHSKNPASPFNGFDVIFPQDVIIRGNTVIDNRELIEDRVGKYVNDLKKLQ